MGKSDLVKFILTTLVKIPNWQEHDFSDMNQPNMASFLLQVAAQKTDMLGQMDIHVIDNAEIVSSKQSIHEIVSICQKAKERILSLSYDSFPSRIIVCTASMSPHWIRALNVEAKATKIKMSPYLIEKKVRYMPKEWRDYLLLCDGIPGKAKLMAWAHLSENTSTSLLSSNQHSIYQMASILLNHSLNETWWDWCETQLSIDLRLLRQLEWIVVSCFSGSSARSLIESSRVRQMRPFSYESQERVRLFGLRALVARHLMHKHLVQDPALESYDKVISWETRSSILEA